MRRKSASDPDLIRNRCVSCRFPPLASWCHVCYYRPKGTTFYWCCGRAGGGGATRKGSRGRGAGVGFPRSSSGLCPPRPRASKNTPHRGAARLMRYHNQTNWTSQTGRTARMTLGVYLGEIHLPACRSRRGLCTGLSVSGWGAVISFTGIRFF